MLPVSKGGVDLFCVALSYLKVALREGTVMSSAESKYSCQPTAAIASVSRSDAALPAPSMRLPVLVAVCILSGIVPEHSETP